MGLGTIIVGLIVGIICAYISYQQAEKKGYNETAFLCLGFFLGVIGLAIAFLVPSKEKQALESADSLLKYKELLDNGVITQEEFDAKKSELLGL